MKYSIHVDIEVETNEFDDNVDEAATAVHKLAETVLNEERLRQAFNGAGLVLKEVYVNSVDGKE